MKTIERIILKLRNKIVVDKGNKILIGENTKIRNSFIKIRGKNQVLKIDDGVNLNRVNIEIRGNNNKIHIDKNTIIGKNVYISAKESYVNVLIGKDCMFSRNIDILTSDGHSILKNNKRINLAQDIIIGDKVWIADEVTILKGSTIKNGCIIGTKSLVNKKFNEKNSLIAGVPAKVLKSDVEWKK